MGVSNLKSQNIATKKSDMSQNSTNNSKSKQDIRFWSVFVYSVLITLSSFIFNSPAEIYEGLIQIMTDTSILLSDYIEIGNLGATLFNVGALMLICLIIVKINNLNITGPILAGILTIAGFAFFGKNIMNVWAIFIGVYLFSFYKKESFGKFILPALFGTALAPLISQVAFGFDFGVPFFVHFIIANIIGVIAGFFVAPLAAHAVTFHKGLNLYNIGFTCGLLATTFMAVFRAFGFNHELKNVLVTDLNLVLTIYLTILFLSMLILGLICNKKSFDGFLTLMNRPGKLISDFIETDGFGVVFINLGILGLFSTAYVLIMGGELNGPVIGGIFTVVGFGAFGKHLKNCIPIYIGVFLAAILRAFIIDDFTILSSTGVLITALFGTTLAPIVGIFGPKFGLLAGFFHMAMVMNVGSLHGGMNLYNNGFAGGVVASILVPLILALKNQTLEEAERKLEDRFVKLPSINEENEFEKIKNQTQGNKESAKAQKPNVAG